MSSHSSDMMLSLMATLTTLATFTIASATRTTAGSYQCVAENELGLSKPETIVLDVQCKCQTWIQ